MVNYKGFVVLSISQDVYIFFSHILYLTDPRFVRLCRSPIVDLTFLASSTYQVRGSWAPQKSSHWSDFSRIFYLPGPRLLGSPEAQSLSWLIWFPECIHLQLPPWYPLAAICLKTSPPPSQTHSAAEKWSGIWHTKCCHVCWLAFIELGERSKE